MVLSAVVDPEQLAEACGSDPSNVCRFVFERTDNVGLSKAVEWLFGAPLQILLVVVGELTHQEAANLLNVPLGTMLSRVSRGRNRLRELLLSGKPV